MNHYPLGQPVPNSVHAVCCSLPTMEAVIGYEEGRPEVTSQVKWAYPRFVFHDYVLRVMRWVSEQALEPGRRFYPTVSTRAAERLVAFADPQTGAVTVACGLVGADLLDTDETFALAKAYLQHTGVCLSSRAAERFLLAHGVVASLQAEERANSAARVVEELAPLVAPAAPQLSASGMNAVHAALDATQRWQGSRGRRVFVQFGWLYLDTQEVLGKLLGSEDGDGKPSTSPVAAEVVVLPDVTDLAALDALFAARGREIAGLITEVPTNPLLQVPDLKRVQRLCHAHGAVCIVDPSLGGVVNLDVLPFCDILVSSLTKYAAHAGDVMMGLLALNPDSPYAAELAPGIAEVLESPDAADVLPLAAQIGRMREVA
ncbi:MAG: PLP-dependent transferase, partial [Opitutales bacterium]